jgi:hypothetical protein
MTEASTEEILRFNGGAFDSVEQSAASEPATESLLPQKAEQRETQRVTFEDDACRGMSPMARYLACDRQPLQITVAKPPTGHQPALVKGSSAGVAVLGPESLWDLC